MLSLIPVATYFAFFFFQSALVLAEETRWTNATGTAATASTFQLNIKPPLPLGVSSTATGVTTQLLNNAFTTLAADATTLLSSLAVYDNTTFRSICPTSDRSEAQACFTTCSNFADKCRTAHASWTSANAGFQKSMNKKKFGGSSSVLNVTTIQYSDYLQTSWGYDTTRITFYSTVNILQQFGQTKRVWPTTIITTENGRETTISTEATQLGIELRTFDHAYASGTGSVISVLTNTQYITTSTEYYSWSFTQASPTCSPTSWTDCNFSKDCSKCTISGGTVRLLYFPVPATPLINATLASSTKTTVTPTITGKPSTAIFGNKTLTSGTVYISFHSAYARNQCGQPIGATYPGAILAMNPKSLSSVNMMWGTMYSSAADPFGGIASSPYLIASSLNLADLNWPYDWDAYQNQPSCQNGPFQSCSVVIKDQFFPLLEVPEEIRQLDPEWDKCELDWEGLYDPPTAMTLVANAATPTVPSVAQTTKAEPKSTGESAVKETGSPVTRQPSQQLEPTKTNASTDGPEATNEIVESTDSIDPGSGVDGEASLPVAKPAEPSDPASLANLGSVIGAVASAASGNAHVTTDGVVASSSFIYDPEGSYNDVGGADSTVTSSVNIGGIIISALGGGGSAVKTHTGSTEGDGKHSAQTGVNAPAESKATPADSITSAQSATITSAESWTLAQPSGLVIILGSSQYTAVQSVAGEIVVDKTATITAAGAALTLPGGANGGTLSMASDGRLFMGNTVQGTGGGTILVNPKQSHELLSASQSQVATESSIANSGSAVDGATAIVTFGSTTWSAVKISQGVQLASDLVLATDVPLTTGGQTIWLTSDGGIVVASGTHRTTIGFRSASARTSEASLTTSEVISTSALSTSAAVSTRSTSQDGCPYWTTCFSDSSSVAVTYSPEATATTGSAARIDSGRIAWIVIVWISSIAAFLYI